MTTLTQQLGNFTRFPHQKAIIILTALFLGLALPRSAPAAWNTTGSLKTPRTVQTATLLTNGQVLVAGGDNGSAPINTSELYNPATRTWTTTSGNLTTAREYHTATLLPGTGQVLVAGGLNSSGNDTRTCELYDPANGTWSTSTAIRLGTARDSHTATLLTNGQVLVAGGIDGNTILASSELYAGTWSTNNTGLSTARYAHTATLLPNGQVLAAGGVASSGDTASCELYNPTLKTWGSTGPLGTARDSHTATLLPNGQVLVAGGEDSNEEAMASAELYNPANGGTWTPTTPLNTARYDHTATLLPNGQVLVAGGLNDTGVLDDCEIYNPATATWSVVSPLHTASQNHTATLLPNGQVLVAGGDNDHDTNAIIGRAELYYNLPVGALLLLLSGH